MSNYRRKKIFGGYYFFTVVTYDRRDFLTCDAVRPLLKNAFHSVQREYPFKTHAFCLLPNHLHCIWQLPNESCDYSKRWVHYKNDCFRRNILLLVEKNCPKQPPERKNGKQVFGNDAFGSILFGAGTTFTIICITSISILSNMAIVNVPHSGRTQRIKNFATEFIVILIGVVLH